MISNKKTMTYLFLKNNPNLFDKNYELGYFGFKYSCRAYNFVSNKKNYEHISFENHFVDLCGVVSSVYCFRIKRNLHFAQLNALYPSSLLIPDRWVPLNGKNSSECSLRTFNLDFLFELKKYSKYIMMTVSEFFTENCCIIGTEATFKLF